MIHSSSVNADSPIELNPAQAKFRREVLHPLKFKLFTFFKLPAVFFSGIRVINAEPMFCETTVPFKWLTQNPFRSTYFASLSMAAELCSGILVMMATQGIKPRVSMLVVEMKAVFYKKAVKVTTFRCNDGDKIFKAVSSAIESGEGREICATSTGFSPEGEEVAKFDITWSFKQVSKT